MHESDLSESQGQDLPSFLVLGNQLIVVAIIVLLGRPDDLLLRVSASPFLFFAIIG